MFEDMEFQQDVLNRLTEALHAEGVRIDKNSFEWLTDVLQYSLWVQADPNIMEDVEEQYIISTGFTYDGPREFSDIPADRWWWDFDAIDRRNHRYEMLNIFRHDLLRDLITRKRESA